MVNTNHRTILCIYVYAVHVHIAANCNSHPVYLSTKGPVPAVLVHHQGTLLFWTCVPTNMHKHIILPALQCHAVCPLPDASLLVLLHYQAPHQGALGHDSTRTY